MSIHNRLAPCLLHLNRWFPKDIVNKILRMAGPCAVQMALLAHNKERERVIMEDKRHLLLERFCARHGEVRLFYLLCEARGTKMTPSQILPLAARAGNVAGIMAFCEVMPANTLGICFVGVAKEAARYGQVGVLEFMKTAGYVGNLSIIDTHLFEAALKGRHMSVALWLRDNGLLKVGPGNARGVMSTAIKTKRIEFVEFALSVIPQFTQDQICVATIASTNDPDFLDAITEMFPNLKRRIVGYAISCGYVKTMNWAAKRNIVWAGDRDRISSSVSADLVNTIGVRYLNQYVELADKLGVEAVFCSEVKELIETKKTERESRKRQRKREYVEGDNVSFKKLK